MGERMPSMRWAPVATSSAGGAPFTASNASAKEEAATVGSISIVAAASEGSATRWAARVDAASTCGASCVSASTASGPSAPRRTDLLQSRRRTTTPRATAPRRVEPPRRADALGAKFVTRPTTPHDIAIVVAIVSVASGCGPACASG